MAVDSSSMAPSPPKHVSSTKGKCYKSILYAVRFRNFVVLMQLMIQISIFPQPVMFSVHMQVLPLAIHHRSSSKLRVMLVLPSRDLEDHLSEGNKLSPPRPIVRRYLPMFPSCQLMVCPFIPWKGLTSESMIRTISERLAEALTEGTEPIFPVDGELHVASLKIKYVILHKIGIANWIPSTHASTISTSLYLSYCPSVGQSVVVPAILANRLLQALVVAESHLLTRLISELSDRRMVLENVLRNLRWVSSESAASSSNPQP
ncbi:flocculation protein FLO11-like [Cucumis melo var. makuwa]|uniref:Flocculation protein FLO11-like n=1 Tax=Cucumis melo var. makuwa TaxID=1194695 RepID=A0A5A7VBB8_CUCMM|nr:flocculation protein FLO11-like [Cucumis melo var. makuwa]TYK08715.1 flocculation protein FLO11-like [Cucumis melo var. makuwa]